MKAFAHTVTVALAIAMSWAATVDAQATPPDATAATVGPAAPPSAADQSYILGPEDVIEIGVIGRQDFQARVRVASDGTVQLPYLGSVVAGNKTTQQLGDEVTKALETGGYFSHPVLRVDIVSYASRYVTVLGSVTNPGLVPIDRPYHLSEILARVGGLREGASDHVVVRTAGGVVSQFSIRALATGDPSQDPIVSPGDTIFSRAAELFYISGQVKTPGGYPLASDMTVSMAIARGGGVTDLGTDRAVTLTRGGKKLVHPDLGSKVEAGDVIEVGERLF